MVVTLLLAFLTLRSGLVLRRSRLRRARRAPELRPRHLRLAKPTVGLVSRDGILPISADQDTAGPLARTVTDAAIVLGVIAGFDPFDPATQACQVAGRCFTDYTQFLDIDALRIVAQGIREVRAERPTMGVVLITHYQRLLDEITPDCVHIIVDGRIVTSGGMELVEQLERDGYEAFRAGTVV